MFLNLLPTKKHENGCKAVYIGIHNYITRNVYNECFTVSQEPQDKKRKNSCICRSLIDTRMLKLMNIEIFLRYQNAETHK